MGFLLRIAGTSMGAEALLDARVFETLSDCAFLRQKPEDALAQGISVSPVAFSHCLVCLVCLVVSLSNCVVVSLYQCHVH